MTTTQPDYLTLDVIVDGCLMTFQRSWDALYKFDAPKIERAERNAHIEMATAQYIAAYALLVIKQHLPSEVRERFGSDICNALEAGDSMGEWIYQWREEIASGLAATLPMDLAEVEES